MYVSNCSIRSECQKQTAITHPFDLIHSIWILDMPPSICLVIDLEVLVPIRQCYRGAADKRYSESQPSPPAKIRGKSGLGWARPEMPSHLDFANQVKAGPASPLQPLRIETLGWAKLDIQLPRSQPLIFSISIAPTVVDVPRHYLLPPPASPPCNGLDLCPSWRASTPMSTRACPAVTGTTTVLTSVCPHPT